IVVDRGESTQIQATLRNHRDQQTTGEFALNGPAGWTFTPALQTIDLAPGETKTYSFTAQPDAAYAGLANIDVNAVINQNTVTSKRVSIGVGGHYVSDLTWERAANHWGPVELDQSVNDLAPNDGRPI